MTNIDNYGKLKLSGSIKHKRTDNFTVYNNDYYEGYDDILAYQDYNSANYVPGEGEICVAVNTGEIRIGNGVDRIEDLSNPYSGISNESSSSNSSESVIASFYGIDFGVVTE